MKVHFYLDRRRDKLVKLPVFLHFWHGGELLRVFAGVHCDSSEWDKRNERVSKKSKKAGKINALLDSMEEEIVRYVYNAKMLRRKFTIIDMKKDISFLKGSESGFFQVWDEFVYENIKEKSWKESTIKRFWVVKSHLISMNEKNALSFSVVDKELLQIFVEHQLSQGLSPNYVKKNVDLLKWFLHWASLKAYLKNLDYKRYKTPGIDPAANVRPEIFLSGKELNKLIHLDLGNDSYILVRDAFCFSCFTGITFTDLKGLRQRSIKGNRLSFTPGKTSKRISLELTDPAKFIIKKYRLGSQSELFPVPLLQNYNKTLKELGRLAGIDEMIHVKYRGEMKPFRKWELLTSRVSRNTFVKLGVDSGIGLEIMSDLLGYSTASLSKYYHVPEDTRNGAIKKISQLVTT